MVFKDRAACNPNGFPAMLSVFESAPSTAGDVFYISERFCCQAAVAALLLRSTLPGILSAVALRFLSKGRGIYCHPRSVSTDFIDPVFPFASVPRRCASPLRGEAASTTTAFRVNLVSLTTYSIFQSRTQGSAAVAASSFRSRGAASTSVPRLESTTICRR